MLAAARHEVYVALPGSENLGLSFGTFCSLSSLVFFIRKWLLGAGYTQF